MLYGRSKTDQLLLRTYFFSSDYRKYSKCYTLYSYSSPQLSVCRYPHQFFKLGLCTTLPFGRVKHKLKHTKRAILISMKQLLTPLSKLWMLNYIHFPHQWVVLRTPRNIRKGGRSITIMFPTLTFSLLTRSRSEDRKQTRLSMDLEKQAWDRGASLAFQRHSTVIGWYRERASPKSSQRIEVLVHVCERARRNCSLNYLIGGNRAFSGIRSRNRKHHVETIRASSFKDGKFSLNIKRTRTHRSRKPLRSYVKSSVIETREFSRDGEFLF